MSLTATIMQFIGGPRHREFISVDDGTNIVHEALPLAQCNRSQEWISYYRRGDQMVFAGRAGTIEDVHALAEAALVARPKAHKKLRGGCE